MRLRGVTTGACEGVGVWKARCKMNEKWMWSSCVLGGRVECGRLDVNGCGWEVDKNMCSGCGLVVG